MLPKKNRVNKKIIAEIFKNGKVVFSKNLIFRFVRNNLAEKKISFLVPKKIAPRAVDRNLLKRRGYFVVKKHFKKIPPSLSGVFIFGKRSKELFGIRKNKKINPVQLLDDEIKTIINKID